MLKFLKERLFGSSAQKPPLPPFELVRAAEVHAAFADICALDDLGFTQLKPTVFAKKRTAEITFVIRLQALKALCYAPWWGVSLSYLPRLAHGKLTYHRTLKSAQLDLYDEPYEYFKLGPGTRHQGTFATEIGHGTDHMRKTMDEMWSTLEVPIFKWLEAASTPEGIAKRCEEQLVRGWRGPSHHPHPLYVLAFSEAVAGRRDQASEALGAYLDVAEHSPEEERLLRLALSEAADTHTDSCG